MNAVGLVMVVKNRTVEDGSCESPSRLGSGQTLAGGLEQQLS